MVIYVWIDEEKKYEKVSKKKEENNNNNKKKKKKCQMKKKWKKGKNQWKKKKICTQKNFYETSVTRNIKWGVTKRSGLKWKSRRKLTILRWALLLVISSELLMNVWALNALWVSIQKQKTFLSLSFALYEDNFVS